MGSYYGAKVESKISTRRYQVKYINLLKEDEPEPLTEVVPSQYIRPQPRMTMAPVGLRLMDKVDAFHNEGWWVGQVIARDGSMVIVYFEETGEKIAFPLYRVRHHQDWIKGNWVPSKNTWLSSRFCFGNVEVSL
ncbi:Agenet domain-containing protein [Cephalotus follicularis]|uniref:Agenet domain-containing protein n=1 Tax=Cephalotus follicularis TaxID=3775 RepID=A0A1Q3AZ50_CEPFO|nr:Agenet domain-containing protein [Cephalotus follicularis]